MKKIIIPIIAIVVIVVLLLVCIPIVNKNANIKKITEEKDQIISMFYDSESTDEQITEYLDRTVSSGDYTIVEIAGKKYLKDVKANLDELTYYITNEDLVNSISIENYKNDGPEFENTLKNLDDAIEILGNDMEKYYEFFQEDVILSYIQAETEDEKLREIYKEIFTEEAIVNDSDREFKDSVEKLILTYERCRDIIDFLVAHKNSWSIENNKIGFTSASLTTEYDNLIANINKVDEEETEDETEENTEESVTSESTTDENIVAENTTEQTTEENAVMAIESTDENT